MGGKNSSNRLLTFILCIIIITPSNKSRNLQMTGNELKAIRKESGLCQTKFYLDAGFYASYANPIENYFGNKLIPPKLEIAIKKKYKNLFKQEEKR
jgi:hypothetical protein